MKCNECGFLESKVVESRDLEEGAAIRRRRVCLRCGNRFTTYERLEMPNLVVVKRDGRREMFDRAKIAGGVYKACEKRPIGIEKVEAAIAEVEREIRATGECEISSQDIGAMVMARLEKLDDVAYVRFASVYRSFTDVASFEAELSRLKRRTK